MYQSRIDQIVEQCPGVIGIADDMLVYGQTEEEHDRNLLNLMEVAKKSGLLFNSQKCGIKLPEIKFFRTHIRSKRSQARSNEGGRHQSTTLTTNQAITKQSSFGQPISVCCKYSCNLSMEKYLLQLMPWWPHLTSLAAVVVSFQGRDITARWEKRSFTGSRMLKSYMEVYSIVCVNIKIVTMILLEHLVYHTF